MNYFTKSGIWGILTALIKGIIFFIACILLFSAVFFLFTVNEAYIPICLRGLMLLTAFLTGIWSSAKEISKGYLRGLISGLLLTVVFIVFSLFLSEKTVTQSAVTYLIMIVISVFGGITGININNTK